jgi:hypothetical protein
MLEVDPDHRQEAMDAYRRVGDSDGVAMNSRHQIQLHLKAANKVANTDPYTAQRHRNAAADLHKEVGHFKKAAQMNRRGGLYVAFCYYGSNNNNIYL